jgi:DMSO/TMAO reductase YedYZ molybdopterin-dependent catalytic subunit
MRAWTRREFIALGAGGVILLAGGTIARVLNTPAQIATSSATLPAPQATPGTFTQSASALPLPLWITRNEDFYTVQYDQVPSVGMESWSLVVHGMVREPLRLSYDEVKALPATTTMHTLECIGNPAGGNLIGNATWRGISLRALLERAGASDRATYVVIGGIDEYFTSVPIATAMHDHAMLAYAMNDQPLPLQHGFPLRAILPGVYGQKQPKWITGIEVTDEDKLGPWEQRGWSRRATIQLNSGITLPREFAQLARGDVLIAGFAHTHEIGVRAVQVSTDTGKTWHETTLTRGPSPFVWTVWGYRWEDPAPGKYVLMVRGIDHAGYVQDQAAASLLRDVFPDGTSGMHIVVVEIRST